MKKVLAGFKEHLELEKQTLLKELKEVGVIKNPKNPKDWQAVPDKIDIQESDPNEVADKIESYENNTAIVNELEGRLMEVDIALNRIEAGTFGFCEIGKEPIEADRLLANPAATTCKKHMK